MSELSNMFVQGIVTELNKELCCFEIDNSTWIQMALVCLDNSSYKLPKIRTKVRVYFSVFRLGKRDIKSIVLTPDDQVEGDFSTDFDLANNDFVLLVFRLDLQPNDLLRILDNYINLVKNFTSLRKVSEAQLLTTFLQILTKNNNDSLPEFELKFLSCLKYIDPNLERYKNLLYWTFGNHWSNYSDYLLGYLFVCDKTGTILLGDFETKIPCIIMNNDPTISNYFNNYVAITNYVIITEIYNSEKIETLKCVLVDFNNITSLNNKKCITESQSFDEYKTATCTLISKSMPIAKSSNSTEFWLHFRNDNENECYLCLEDSYSTFQPGYTYDLHYKKIFKTVCNIELKKINQQVQQYKVSSSSIFVPKEFQGKNILTVSEALVHLENNTKPISFQGKIMLKKFINPLASYTNKVSDDDIFGTPGNKTPLLEFKGDEDEILGLYLNNWENIMTPYCLIPNMRVIVYNVTPQRGKYYKSNIMTCFEVLEYETVHRFNTVDWSSHSWGIPFFLGSQVVPCGAVIWARTVTSFILGLKIFKKVSNNIGTQITLVTTDKYGESKVLAKDKYGLVLLELLLGSSLQSWTNQLCTLGSYTFSKGMTFENSSTENVQDPKERTRRLLNQRFSLINVMKISLDLMCRKMDEEPSGKPVYFLLDARIDKKGITV